MRCRVKRCVCSKGRSMSVFARRTIRCVRRRGSGGRPFFLSMTCVSPRSPQDVPSRCVRLCSRDRVRLPPGFVRGRPFSGKRLRVHSRVLTTVPHHPSRVGGRVERCCTVVSRMSGHMNGVVRALGSGKLCRGAVVVFTKSGKLTIKRRNLVKGRGMCRRDINIPLVVGTTTRRANGGATSLYCLVSMFPALYSVLRLPMPRSMSNVDLLSSLSKGRPIHSCLCCDCVSGRHNVSSKA